MPIKINVPFGDKDQVKSLGAWWLAQEKTWVIPDTIIDINPFKPWLPKEDGIIVKWPHVVVKSKRRCWKCGEDTPLIAFGAKSFYEIQFQDAVNFEWERYDDNPVLFTEVEVLDPYFATIVQQKYPFFRLTYSKSANFQYWANNCIHCQSLQGDNYNFMDSNMIFCFDRQDMVKGNITRDYLKLSFDYYIQSGYLYTQSNAWVLG